MKDRPNQNKPVMLHITVAIITGFLGAAEVFASWHGPWWVLLSYSVFALVAAILKLGWLIPCTILGGVFGLMFGFGVALLPVLGDSSSVVDNSILAIFLMFCGIVFGVFFDVVPQVTEEEEPINWENESDSSYRSDAKPE